MLYITSGNLVWWSVLVCMVLLTAGMFLLLRNRSEAECWSVFRKIAVFIAIAFVIQRFFLVKNVVFVEMYGGMSFDNFVAQLLPMNPCYLGVILVLVAEKWNNQGLRSFLFFFSSLGAMLGTLFTEACYTDISLLEPSVFLSYLLHLLMFAMYLNIGFLGFVDMSVKNVIRADIVMLGFFVVVHGVNLLGTAAGIPNMNYFYTMQCVGNPWLELFRSLIPVPMLYVIIPALVLGAVWAIILKGICWLIQRNTSKNTENDENKEKRVA